MSLGFTAKKVNCETDEEVLFPVSIVSVKSTATEDVVMTPKDTELPDGPVRSLHPRCWVLIRLFRHGWS